MTAKKDLLNLLAEIMESLGYGSQFFFVKAYLSEQISEYQAAIIKEKVLNTIRMWNR